MLHCRIKDPNKLQTAPKFSKLRQQVFWATVIPFLITKQWKKPFKVFQTMIQFSRNALNLRVLPIGFNQLRVGSELILVFLFHSPSYWQEVWHTFYYSSPECIFLTITIQRLCTLILILRPFRSFFCQVQLHVEASSPVDVVNPLSVSIQSCGKKRLLLDLRHVNKHIWKENI